MSRSASSSPTTPQRMGAAWQRLHPRERRLVALSAAVVGLALLWWLALAPPLRMLREASAQRTALESQAQQMQMLQREATALKAQPRIGQEEALRALKATTEKRLGASAQLAVVGDRANVTLKAVSAGVLAEWLTDARVNARAMPVDARLTRQDAPAAGGVPVWSGTLSLSLPSP